MAKTKEDNKTNVEKFVNRLFKKTINRYPRDEEETAFITCLEEKGAEEAVREFFLSERFETYSNKDFVTALFKGIMDIVPDEERFNFWLGKMEIRSKTGVINGFFLSDEWKGLCKNHGIEV